MTYKFDVLSIGEPLVGLYPVADDPETARIVYGGDTSNVALAVAQLGLRSAFAGAIGEDPWGYGFDQLWRERDVDTSMVIIDPNRFTGMYVISFTRNEHRFAYYRKGSAASVYSPSAEMVSGIAQARILHLSGISQAISVHMTELLFEVMAKAKDQGTLVSYDINYRAPLWSASHAGAIAERTITEYADIVSTNTSEFVALGLASTKEEFFTRFGKCTQMIAVRDGENGATVSTSKGVHHAPAHQVEVADTVGAGDAFDAGLLTAFLEKLNAADCVAFANAVAALTCTKTGSTKGHPSFDQAKALVEKTHRTNKEKK